MLRRRILASTMASVMAIGSVAVVASADETTAAVTNVKTRADLEAYVKSFDTFRENEIYDYGSISGENFLNALEYADNVLDDAKSSVDDFTVAYAMIEAVYNNLRIYTAEELSALIKSCTSTYEQNNVYNDELDDAVYSADSWTKFEDAYDEAVAVERSSDSRIITDAYEGLNNAKTHLAPLPVVTKAQFRKTLKEYETILQKEFAYDSWRLGNINGWATIRILTKNGDGVKKLGDWGFYGQNVTYGTLYEYAKHFEGIINDAYSTLDGIKEVNKTSNEDIVKGFTIAQDLVDIYNGFVADDTDRATKANVKKLLDKYHGRLVHDYATTDAEDLYDMVVAAVGKENLHNRLGDDYYSEIDKDVPATTVAADAWYVKHALFKDFEDPTKENIYKDVDAMISVKTDVTFYMIKDDNGNVTSVVTTKPAAGTEYSTVRAKSEVDLTDHVVLNASDVTADFSPVDNHNINGINDGDAYGADASTWSGFQNWDSAYSFNASPTNGAFGGSYTNSSGDAVESFTFLDKAIELAYTYIEGDKDAIKASDIYDIDTTDSIVDGLAKGSSSEWTLVYRYLKYALSDKYDVTVGTHTKADVEKLIEDCYELAELTGDAALFTVNHDKMVKARQDALTWVKAASKDKTYIDNTVTYEIADSNGMISGSKVADQVYNDLEDYYNELMDDYNAFKYSFGEIYNKISDVKDAIDNGDLEATEALLAALSDTAYKLSVVEPITKDKNDDDIELNNDAFTGDRFFNDFNRVYTFTDADNAYDLDILEDNVVKTVSLPAYKATGEVTSHADLKDAYEALLAEVKKQTDPEVKLGDVNKDGVVNALDASEILKAAVNNTVIDVKVGDFNADGAVNALDASAILKAVVNNTLA